MIESSSKKVFFPGLNGLRFFAAFGVVIHHIEKVKADFDIPRFHNPVMEALGDHAVTFFFVLSGFLITYLLFIEREVSGDINIKSFYMRRILRIWPLYFMILILSFFILPNIGIFHLGVHEKMYRDFAPLLILFATFLPNVARAFYAPVPYAYQAWSIGVEEQFYLFWPALIKYIKKPMVAIGTVLIMFFALKAAAIGLRLHTPKSSPHYEFHKKIYDLVFFTRIQCMALGGVFAWLYYSGSHRFLAFIYKGYMQVLVYGLCLLLIFTSHKIPYFNYIGEDIFSLIFGIIILNVSTNRGTILKMENKVLNYLGKISYGIYMYHLIGITVAFLILQPLFRSSGNTVVNNALLYILSPLFTILISGISYRYFEQWFIKAKLSFSKVISGDNAKQG